MLHRESGSARAPGLDGGARVIRLLAAGASGTLLVFGQRTGLLAALARSPTTPDELARAAGGDERLTLEWLRGMCATGLVTRQGEVFELEPGVAAVLAPSGGDGSLMPGIELLGALTSAVDTVADSFADGGPERTVHDHAALTHAMENMSATWSGLLVDGWIPAIDGLGERLRAGGAVAEVGCGDGRALEALARAYPRTVCTGFDLDADLVRVGRDRIAAQGLADRVTLVAADAAEGLGVAAYDLVLALTVLHDVGDPALMLRQVRRSLRPGGDVLVVEAARPTEGAADPIAAMLYATSLLHCVPTTLLRTPTPLGTLGLTATALAGIAREAGLGAPVRLSPSTPFVTAYHLDGTESAVPRSSAAPGRADALALPHQPARRIAARGAVVAMRAATLGAVTAVRFPVDAALHGTPTARARSARRIVAGLPRLGAVAVKFGQMASARSDVVPPYLHAALSRLQDSTPAMSAEQRDEAWAGACRDNSQLSDLTLGTCVGTGSVACVYSAVSPGGDRLAVKLRRPGLGTQMASDLAMIGASMRVAQRLPAAGGAPLADLVTFMSAALYGQLDFHREARNTIALHANLADQTGIIVPEVVPEYCSATVITTRYIDGLRRAPADVPAEVRQQAAEAALAAMSEMIFRDGFVHCDLHAGNLRVRVDGSVALIDAGYCVELPGAVRDDLREFFGCLAMADGAGCGAVVFDAAVDPPSDRRAEFLGRVASLVDEVVESGQFAMPVFGRAIFDVQNEFGIHPPSEFAFPLMSMLVVEGTLQSWWPELDMSRAGALVATSGRRAPSPVEVPDGAAGS